MPSYKRKINRRKDSSKGRLKIRNTHIGTKFLDSVFSPVVRIKKSYYGINSATFHSNINTDSYATSTDSKVKVYAVAGDALSLQCLPGRQIYAEFTMFPQIPLTSANTTDSNISKLDCLSVDIAKMMDKAYEYANILSISQTNFNPRNKLDDQTSYFSSLLVNGNYDVYKYNRDDKKYRQSKFHYEGGTHIHEFTNPTNMPIYIELIEYKPRNLMKFSESAFYSDTGDISDINVSRYPGLYESIYLDRCDQKPYDNSNVIVEVNGNVIAGAGATGAAGGAADNTKYDRWFNELDDKGFKVNGKMSLTNMRWKILNKVVVRVDPGNVYKYTVEHQPFSFSVDDLLRYNEHYRVHAETDATSLSSFQPSAIWGMNPRFSRGLAVRCWGSKGFVGGNTQRNSFGPDVNGVIYNNNVQANSKNDKAGLHTLTLSALVTHAAVLTHQCTESHKFRMCYMPDNGIKLYEDHRHNAASGDDVKTSDSVAFMNRENLNLEVMDFET